MPSVAPVLQPWPLLMPTKLPLFPGTTSLASPPMSLGAPSQALCHLLPQPPSHPPCSLWLWVSSTPCLQNHVHTGGSPDSPQSFRPVSPNASWTFHLGTPSSSKVASLSLHSGSSSHILSLNSPKPETWESLWPSHPPLAAISYRLGMYFTVQVPSNFPHLSISTAWTLL